MVSAVDDVEGEADEVTGSGQRLFPLAHAAGGAIARPLGEGGSSSPNWMVSPLGGSLVPTHCNLVEGPGEHAVRAQRWEGFTG